MVTDNAGHLYVFWRNGTGHLEEIICGAGAGCGAGAPQEVTVNGHVIGPMGSAPAVGGVVGLSKLDPGSMYVFWRGTGAHRLWVAYLRFARWWGPHLVRDTNGHVIGPMGSGPTVGLFGQEGWLFWQNAADKGLEETTFKIPYTGPHVGPKIGRFAPQHQAKIAVQLASAPFLTPLFGQNCLQSLFWKGRNADLWWACYHHRWYGPTNLHAGPIN